MAKKKILRLPDKERFYVNEAACFLAKTLDESEGKVRRRLYRGIDNERIEAIRVLGVMMIPRTEVERLATGESING